MIEKKMNIVPSEEAMTPVQTMIEELMDEAMVPMKIAMKIGIVVDEVFSNIIRYSKAGQAQICCYIEEGKLSLIFIDDGVPYNPLEAKEPDITADVEDREIGGLGIFITRKMMDSIAYSYEEGKNHLVLTKNI